MINKFSYQKTLNFSIKINISCFFGPCKSGTFSPWIQIPLKYVEKDAILSKFYYTKKSENHLCKKIRDVENFPKCWQSKKPHTFVKVRVPDLYLN